MTVGELERRMSNREFVEWNAYHGLKNQRAEIASRRRR
jgi:hypothetical protein